MEDQVQEILEMFNLSAVKGLSSVSWTHTVYMDYFTYSVTSSILSPKGRVSECDLMTHIKLDNNRTNTMLFSSLSIQQTTSDRHLD